jgi:hypothetical protein
MVDICGCSDSVGDFVWNAAVFLDCVDIAFGFLCSLLCYLFI